MWVFFFLLFFLLVILSRVYVVMSSLPSAMLSSSSRCMYKYIYILSSLLRSTPVKLSLPLKTSTNTSGCFTFTPVDSTAPMPTSIDAYFIICSTSSSYAISTDLDQNGPTNLLSYSRATHRVLYISNTSNDPASAPIASGDSLISIHECPGNYRLHHSSCLLLAVVFS